jgi:hypothetical protein
MGRRILFEEGASAPAAAEEVARASSVGFRGKQDQRKDSWQSPLLRRDLLTWLRRSLQLPMILGLFGGALLAGGADAPLIHIPIVGSLSYLRHPAHFTVCRIGEIVILAAAGLSVAFALVKRHKMLWLTGTVALAQLIATLVIFEHDVAAVVAKADQPDLVDPIIMWAGSALQRSHFEWGIAVVAGGAVMVLAAALCDGRNAAKTRKREQTRTSPLRPTASEPKQ